MIGLVTIPFFLIFKSFRIYPIKKKLFFCDERRIILYDSWVHQHVTSTLDYKIVPTL
jgi:hypothetical protein